MFFIRALAKSLNFFLNITHTGPYGSFSDNGIATGCFEELQRGRTDLIVADFWLKSNRLKFFDATTPYVNEQMIFVVSPAREISTFQRLYRPFSTVTWIMFFACIILACIVIFIVKRGSQNVQNFVFGDGVRDPYLNFCIATIGTTQPRLPRRNFARFILMLYILFSIIFRTLYAGSYYKQMQLSKKVQQVQSIEEMIEKNYQFYIFDHLMDLFDPTSRLMKR